MYAKDTGTKSKQQKFISNLVNGKLNYPVSRCQLDIAFPDKMIYIEYDGSGHDLSVKFGDISRDDFYNKEIKRKRYLQNLGWKIIRIISKEDLLPNDEKIIELIQFCEKYLNNNHSWVEIDIDNSVMKCAKFEENIDLGKLRRID